MPPGRVDAAVRAKQEWARLLNVKVESAMISDVPGYTWGIVPALAQAGVKYFSDRAERERSAGPDQYGLGR